MSSAERWRLARALSGAALLLAVSACSSTHWPLPPATVTALDNGLLAVHSEQLAACTSTATSPDALDPRRPVTLIVHGCSSSGGKYGALAEVFREQGQQALCFNYDDRDSITRSSAQLRETLRRLIEQAGVRDITVLGHSQGGLVARHALVTGTDLESSLQQHPSRLRLVTVSSPFGGIRAASHCGSTTLAVLSLGLTIPICQLVTGSKWREIPAASHFIRQPGQLLAAVQSHLKIVTDEAGTCRRRNDSGGCVASDAVFSLAEQRQSTVDRNPPATELTVAAGHVEIVGDAQKVPYKLISILQQHDILAARLAELQFLSLLDSLYASEARP